MMLAQDKEGIQVFSATFLSWTPGWGYSRVGGGLLRVKER